ncbi:MAG: alpha/beta fold hydrolase [Planctomycetaceae bacterium]
MDLTPFATEYPFAPHWLDVGGVRMHYIDEGADEPLLFVHGNPTWSFAWRNLVKHFSPRQRCIAVDHIGCGRSDKPLVWEYTLDRRIADLVQLIDELDLRDITLVAHDWGGCIGMGAAAARPERFRRFVLMNTGAFRSSRMPLRIAVCRLPLFGTLALRGFNAFSRGALRMAVERPRLLTKAVKAGYLAPYDTWKHRIAVQRFVQDIPRDKSHPSFERLVQVEQGLAQFQDRPMLLPWGERDWCFNPEFRKEFERRFPQAESYPIGDAGHYVFEDATAALIARIEQFLGDHPLTHDQSHAAVATESTKA